MDRDCIVQIIENAKETDHVDFKREFYKSLSESDLPKDIAAFANTALTEDKYIIFGVEDESRQVIGIDAHTLPSQDSLDEYLASTIEPFVHAEIDTIDYQESIVIGYIKVFAKNTDRPYMIKKIVARIIVSIGAIFIFVKELSFKRHFVRIWMKCIKRTVHYCYGSAMI